MIAKLFAKYKETLTRRWFLAWIVTVILISALSVFFITVAGNMINAVSQYRQSLRITYDNKSGKDISLVIYALFVKERPWFDPSTMYTLPVGPSSYRYQYYLPNNERNEFYLYFGNVDNYNDFVVVAEGCYVDSYDKVADIDYHNCARLTIVNEKYNQEEGARFAFLDIESNDKSSAPSLKYSIK